MAPRSGWVTAFAGVRGQRGLNESEIPAAHGGEGGESVASREAGVRSGPLFLVEGLDGVAVLGQGLAQAKTEGDLAVGEMAEDVAGGPFAGRGSGGDPAGTDGGGKRFEARGGGGEHLNRLLVAEEAGVRVEGGRGHIRFPPPVSHSRQAI